TKIIPRPGEKVNSPKYNACPRLGYNGVVVSSQIQ
ncbi:unnamed protein product, partial [marine sediment metagenome]